jgi:AAA ATPase containing von Willebrand factor type A (vWA) domain
MVAIRREKVQLYKRAPSNVAQILMCFCLLSAPCLSVPATGNAEHSSKSGNGDDDDDGDDSGDAETGDTGGNRGDGVDRASDDSEADSEGELADGFDRDNRNDGGKGDQDADGANGGDSGDAGDDGGRSDESVGDGGESVFLKGRPDKGTSTLTHAKCALQRRFTVHILLYWCRTLCTDRPLILPDVASYDPRTTCAVHVRRS